MEATTSLTQGGLLKGIFLKDVIAKRLALGTILFSTLVTLIITALQLFGEYRNDLRAIHQRLAEIELTQVPHLTNSLWAFDTEQIQAQIDGIVQLPDMETVAVSTESGSLWKAGMVQSRKLITVRLPLVYTHLGRQTVIGFLDLGTSLDNVYYRLWDRLVVILLGNAVKTTLVGLFILFLFQLLVTRHIYDVAAYAEQLTLDQDGQRPLRLARRARTSEQPDALSRLATSINVMRENLVSAHAETKQREARLREANALLEKQAVELEELNARYIEEREIALAASKAKSAFLANMSHELRTPLNSVIGYSEILTRQPSGLLPEKYQEYGGYILSSGHHLLNVINEILDMSRIEAGKFTLHAEETDMSSIIENCLSLVKVRTDERSQRLTKEIGIDMPVTRVDSRVVKQVLLNFLSNAIKFTPPGGDITVRCGRDADGWVSVAVADNGRGIAPENLPHVFEPFWQEDAVYSRRSGGTGLGLSISKKLIELHGGMISVESVRAQGTTASFRLPPECVVHPPSQAQ